MKLRLRTKLQSQVGETLTESLVSLLISSLSILMLATAISAAFSMVNTSRTKLSNYYKKNNDVAAQPMSGSIAAGKTSGTVSIANSDPSTVGFPSATPTVTLFTNDDGGAVNVVSYKKSVTP